MATINDKATFASCVVKGIAAIADRRGQSVETVEADIASEGHGGQLPVAVRTLRSWKYPSSAPNSLDEDKLLGLAWLAVYEGGLGLDWLTKLLRATSVIVLDPPTPDWLRACFAQARLAGHPPPQDQVEAVIQRLFPAAAPAPMPTPAQVSAYCYLLVKAYGPWAGLYIEPDKAELRDPPSRPRVGRGPRQPYDDELGRRYDHVTEQMGLPRREPIQVPLADWFWERRRMALLAVPGCGKTTTLQALAGELAYQTLQQAPAWDSLPLFISLGDYGDSGQSLAEFLPEGVRQAAQRALVGWSRAEPEQAAAEAHAEIAAAWPPLVPHLEALRRAGRLTLLLDSLNELPGGAEGPLRPAVEAFVHQSKAWGNRVAVACRVADYHSRIAELDRVELLPFDLERIHQALLRHVSDAESRAEAERLWAELGRPENVKLRELLEIPLYIEVLSKSLERDAAGHYRLPANRGELLDGFVRALLRREHQRAAVARRPLLSPQVLHAALAETAYRMRDELGSRGSSRDLAPVHAFLARALLAEHGSPDAALDLAAGAGLVNLDRQRGQVSFWKEPVEEVLAARHLLARFADGYVAECQALWRVPMQRGDPRLADDRDLGDPPQPPATDGAWEQTTILAAGLAGVVERRVTADDFLLAVLAVNPHLAGRCLLEGGAQASEPVRKQVQQTLLTVMQDRRYSVRARIPCGVLLGRLPEGDPRFHGEELFCLPREPLLGFVEVPAGPFRLGSDRRTIQRWNKEAEAAGFGPGLYDDELEQDGPQPLPYAYWVARYPVTNAQFRCFVADGGYTARWRHLWTTEGQRWLDGDRWSEALDRAWRNYYYFRRARGELSGYADYEEFLQRGVRPFLERLRKEDLDGAYWTDPELNPPNQPVVGVTWYEAAAYAAWLGARLAAALQAPAPLRERLAAGWQVRLPSEPEWEKAARGGLEVPDGQGRLQRNRWPARPWPWGDTWDAGRANTAEGDEAVKWLSPVGVFPDGASPYGCLDLVGNVWEWTRSRYDDYPYPTAGAALAARETPEGAALRVVRGGSWHDNRRNARCACRDRNIPNVRDYYLGVRVVCGPILS